MFRHKSINREGIPSAIQKAERYRLLSEPRQAESICLDVLEIDPENQQTLIILLLALTDQFEQRMSAGVREAREIVPKLKGEYTQDYYSGIICERLAIAQYHRRIPGIRHTVYEGVNEAMEYYEKAAELSPPENDEAILRWNSCARFLSRHPKIEPAPEESFETWLE